MLAKHFVDLTAEATLAVFSVIGKLLVLELYEVEEVWRINVCKGVDLVKARAHAHHIQVDDRIIDMLLEFLDCKNKGVGINGEAIVATWLETNRLTEVLHDTSDQDFCVIGNAAVVIFTKPIWLTLKQLPITLREQALHNYLDASSIEPRIRIGHMSLSWALSWTLIRALVQYAVLNSAIALIVSPLGMGISQDKKRSIAMLPRILSSQINQPLRPISARENQAIRKTAILVFDAMKTEYAGETAIQESVSFTAIG